MRERVEVRLVPLASGWRASTDRSPERFVFHSNPAIAAGFAVTHAFEALPDFAAGLSVVVVVSFCDPPSR